MYIFILLVSLLIIIISIIKSHHFFGSLFLSALQGIIALFAVNFAGGFIALHLNVNVFSLLVSAFGGLPGVIFLVVNDIVAKL